jgi:hypothetical protein
VKLANSCVKCSDTRGREAPMSEDLINHEIKPIGRETPLTYVQTPENAQSVLREN